MAAIQKRSSAIVIAENLPEFRGSGASNREDHPVVSIVLCGAFIFNYVIAIEHNPLMVL
jgi:hypothetical protein